MPFWKPKKKPVTSNRAIPARLTRALNVASTSVDTTARTFGFVLSTENPVRICGMLPDLGFVEFDEVLSADGLDGSRLAGAPVVDSHDLSTIDRVIGVIEAASRDGTTWNGTGRLSKNDKGERVLIDLADNIIRQVSVGYTVQQYEVTMRDGQVPLARATKWTPHEVSVVAVGADPAAVIRAADFSNPQSPENESMDPELLAALQAAADKLITAAEAASDAADAISAAAPADGSANDAVTAASDAADQAVDAADAANTAVSDLGGDDAAESNGERGKRVEGLRGAKEARAKARADAGAGDQTQAPEKKDPAAADEMDAARSMARKAGLGKLADQLIGAGAGPIEVRSALLNALVARSEAVGEIVTRPASGANSETPKRSLAADVYGRMNKRSA